MREAFKTPLASASPWRLGIFLYALLMILAAMAMSWGLSTTAGVIACSAGAMVGVFLGAYLATTRLRSWLFLAGGALGLLLSSVFAAGVGRWSLVVDILGGDGALVVSEILWWGGGSLSIFTAMRAMALRSPAWVAVELLLPIFGAASLFASHRQDSIHRPQYLADWALERGEDPIWYLLMIGVAAACVLALGLLRVSRRTQGFVGVVILVMLFSGIFWLFSFIGPGTVERLVQRMGGQGKAKKKDQKQDQKQKDKMPFDPPPPPSSQPRPRTVAIVLFYNEHQPKLKVHYFRQRSLAFFNGLRLEKDSRKDLTPDTLSYFPSDGAKAKLPKPLGKRKTVRHRISLMTTHTNPFALLEPVQIEGISNPNPRLFVRAYEVESLVFDEEFKLDYKVGNPAWSKDLQQYYTHAPKLEAYRELLADILRPLPPRFAKNPTAKAYFIKMWLDKHTLYSLNPPPAYLMDDIWKKHNEKMKKDNPWYAYRQAYPNYKPMPFPDPRYEQMTPQNEPVGHFLFRNRVGYCVHLAHASVFLMRLAGIPARLAEGYAVPDDNRGGTSALQIRDIEAHAWPELYLEGIGWTPLDPSPQAIQQQQQPPPDPQEREMLSKLSRKNTPPPPTLKALKLPKDKLDPILKQRPPLRINPFPFFLAFLILLYLIKWGRRYAFWFARGERRLQLFWLSLEDRLCELGMRRPIGEALEVFATRFVEKVPALKPLVEQMTAKRLGSRLPIQADAKALLACQMQMWRVASILRHQIAWLDPISWSLHIFARWRILPPPAWERLQSRIAAWKAKRKERALQRKAKKAAATVLSLFLLFSLSSHPAQAGIRPDLYTSRVFSEKWMRLTPLEQQALQYFRKGQQIELRTLVERKLLPQQPNSYAGRFLLAYVLRHQEGELVQALFLLRQAMALFEATAGQAIPTMSHHIMLLEKIYSLRQLGRDTEALKLISQHDRLYPIVKLEDLRPWSLMKLRRYEEATQLAKGFLQKGRYKTTALNALCAITFERGQRLESLTYCRQAFEEDEKLQSRDKTTHRVNLAEAYMGVFRLDEAERYSLEATRFFYPSLHTNPWEFLTYLYLEQGNLNQAFNALRQANRWKSRQLPHLKESLFATHQLSQGNFWLSVGDAARAQKELELIRDRPDRHGHTSSEPRQQAVGAYMMLRHARKMENEILREEAAAESWWGRIKLWFRRVGVRIGIWQDGAMARRRLAQDPDFLRNTLSPYRSGSANMPYWMAGDLVELIGPAVVRAQIATLRQREQRLVPDIKAYYDAIEAEAVFLQGDDAEALRLTQAALADLPNKIIPLRMRMWGLRAEIFRRQGKTAAMHDALSRILQRDGTILRRLGLFLPVRFQIDDSQTSYSLRHILTKSPRFSEDSSGFVLSIQDKQRYLIVMLSSPQGTVLARGLILRKPKEKPDAFLKRANRELHQIAFSHKANFSRRDASSLDDSLIGTPIEAVPWKKILDEEKKQQEE